MSRFKVAGNFLADKIDAILPQIQCGQCGFPACRPYAEAIAKGEADINQCPPGGEAGIRDLANLLGIEPKPLNTKHGREKLEKTVAVIDENLCIGCTLCIRACPVDAILGATKQMHTVIEKECTGCDLCLAPCPVDCIKMVPINQGFATADIRARERDREKANLSRKRYEFRQQRLKLEKAERASRLHKKKSDLQTAEQPEGKIDKKAAILAAVERARAKRIQRY